MDCLFCTILWPQPLSSNGAISSEFCRRLAADNENDQSVTCDAFDLLHAVVRKRLACGKLAITLITSFCIVIIPTSVHHQCSRYYPRRAVVIDPLHTFSDNAPQTSWPDRSIWELHRHKYMPDATWPLVTQIFKDGFANFILNRGIAGCRHVWRDGRGMFCYANRSRLNKDVQSHCSAGRRWNTTTVWLALAVLAASFRSPHE